MRSIIGLQTPDEGEIEVFGEPMIDRDEEEAKHVRRRWGVLFQGGALFSTLTVAENVQVPIREFYPGIEQPLLDEIAAYKIIDVRPARRRGPEISVRAVGRHAQARRGSPARWRSIPSSCFSTSRPPGSIRSAPPPSTS
jgi:phospholipid/cholesterol/gamma-HCH transport system ATP-binding protein